MTQGQEGRRSSSMTSKIYKCGRCGVPTSAEFCRDCQTVDPVMTAGGLTAKQMRQVRALETLRAREETAMFYRAAGHLTYQANLAKDAAKRRERNAQRRARRAA